MTDICCDSMSELVANTNHRGFSGQFPDPSNIEMEKRIPLIIFRAFNEGSDNNVNITASVPVSIDGSLGFRFCPWCGKKLVD